MKKNILLPRVESQKPEAEEKKIGAVCDIWRVVGKNDPILSTSEQAGEVQAVKVVLNLQRQGKEEDGARGVAVVSQPPAEAL
jgi:hypothetical protein